MDAKKEAAGLVALLGWDWGDYIDAIHNEGLPNEVLDEVECLLKAPPDWRNVDARERALSDLGVKVIEKERKNRARLPG